MFCLVLSEWGKGVTVHGVGVSRQKRLQGLQIRQFGRYFYTKNIEMALKNTTVLSSTPENNTWNIQKQACLAIIGEFLFTYFTTLAYVP